MIIRIVRLQFKPEFVGEFLRLYQLSEANIRGMDGCESVRLLQDTCDHTVFFTLSEWRDESALDRYRHSDFFRTLWPAVKAGFSGPPTAFSTKEQA
jgi:quinol monooxygenase YgiN